MPKIDRIEFASKARVISPRLFLAIMSAYRIKDLDISPDIKVSELLQKPVTPSQLNLSSPIWKRVLMISVDA